MKKLAAFFLVLLVVPGAGAAQASRAYTLAALLTHEFEEVTVEGVTKYSRYQERFYRQGSNVWTERVFPNNRPAAVHKPSGHQHDVDLATASRHITRTINGKAKIAFVSVPDKVIINVSAEDYPTVGFNGSWDSAYHIVKPQFLRTMTRSKIPSPVSGAVWYEKDVGKETTRILWSSSLALPLVIESRSKQGYYYTKVSVKLIIPPARGRMPWELQKQLTHVDFADMGD